MWPSGGGKEGSPDRAGGAVVSGTGPQEWPSNSLEGEEQAEEVDGDELGLSFPASHLNITRNKHLHRTPRVTSTKLQAQVEETLSVGENKKKDSRGWGEWGSEEESGSGSEEGVDGYCMNGRDSGIHLDDDGRFDDASNPDLRSNRSSTSRLAQSTSDLSLYHSGSDVQLNQSSPDLLNPDRSISVFESLPSTSGGSDGALNRPAVLKDALRHSEYFSEEEEERENIVKEAVQKEGDQSEREQYIKEEEEEYFKEEVEQHRDAMKEEPREEGQYQEEESIELDDEPRREEDDEEEQQQEEEGEEEEKEELGEDEETEEEEEGDEYGDYSNDSSFQDTSLSPAGLGGQMYKSCTFFDLSLDDDAAFTPSSTRSPRSTFHREAPLLTRSNNNEQLNLEEHVRGAGYQAEEKLPWPDLFPRSERQFFGPDSYLDESELLEAKAEQLREEPFSTSYDRGSIRPRDFWADADDDADDDDDELEESDGEDEVLRYLDDELLALQGEREQEMVAANWYNYYFVQPKKGHPSWVANFSPCPGLRPISDYRFFQPGYLEVITEDDETVSALSEKADESTKSSSGSSQHAHNNKTMDTAQTTFSEQKEKVRENGVQREDSGIVMEPDYKDQNDVILYNNKKVTNGCDVSTGDEDEGSGSHGNMVELVNGDNKESESDLNDSASERHDTTDTQSDTENDSDALMNMGHEQKGSNKPKSQTTTVILTTKEYLANGHCRTIIETTRTVRDENGKESASKEIRIETTEPPMPQLKEEDENVETVPQDPHAATTTTITPTATHTEPTRLEVNDDGDKSDIPKVSLTAATPRQSIDEDDSPHADTQPEVIEPVEATPVAAAPTAGDDKQISSPVQTSPPEPCPEPEIVKLEEPEVAIRSGLQEAEVIQSVPADAQNEVKTTTKQQQVEVVEEVILSQTRADAPVEATPPTIAAEPAEVKEEVVVAKQIIRVRGIAPRKPERTPSVREPVVVVTDPTTEKAVLQNNNSLLPCGDNEYLDANVIADLVYRRFRPNVAKRKLIVLLFPPPYQELGEPIEEPTITPVRVKKETALPPLFSEDVVKADPEEKDEELRNATGEACPGVDDDEQKGRKRHPGFFRRVVRALRRTFNRG